MSIHKDTMPNDQSRRTVAIVGAGPAGAALAIRLRLRDVPVVVLDADKRPPLLVGESLVPAAVPHLEALGVTETIAAFSVRKPGASLIHHRGERAQFNFQKFGTRAPNFAWNVPRPRFDDVLVQRARELGAQFVAGRVRLAKAAHADTAAEVSLGREISLDPASLERAGLSAQPGLIVDATGRARCVSRTLGLSAKRGGRDDVACFAHFSDARDPDIADGRVAISVLEQGWSWRIPLRDRVSVGVVVPRAALADAGGSAESLLDARLREEPLLRKALAGSRRLTGAMRYEHYQLVGERASGPGWVAVGDAFGFVDPMLSPGVFMALESAAELDRRIQVNATDHTLDFADAAGYEACLRQWFSAWTEVIETFYDGRMLALQRASTVRGEAAGSLSVHPLIERFARRSIARLVSGANTRSRLARGVLAHSARHLLRDIEPESAAAAFAVQGSDARTTDFNWTAYETTPVPSS